MESMIKNMKQLRYWVDYYSLSHVQKSQEKKSKQKTSNFRY